MMHGNTKLKKKHNPVFSLTFFYRRYPSVLLGVEVTNIKCFILKSLIHVVNTDVNTDEIRNNGNEFHISVCAYPVTGVIICHHSTRLLS